LKRDYLGTNIRRDPFKLQRSYTTAGQPGRLKERVESSAGFGVSEEMRKAE
jgi:hypothetical protein